MLLTLGALVGAIAMAPPASAPPGLGLSWLLFVGSSAHVAATGWLYALPAVRAYARERPMRFVYAPIGLVAIAAVVSALMPSASFAWLLLPYFAWQLVHFQKQNLGMAALAASSNGVAALRPAERHALAAAGLAGAAALVARPGVLQIAVDPGLGQVLPVSFAVFCGAVATGAFVVARRPRDDRPAAFCIVYVTSLCFALPVFLFESPYAAVGGMTIAHGLQYLLLVGLVAAGGSRGRRRVLRVVAFCNVALLGGAALNAASHLHAGDAAARFLFGASLGIAMAHFVIDAGIWRLRDPVPRRLLATHLPYLTPGRAAPASASAGDRSASDI
ncbi:MAG TPA: hypothetical protein VF549_16050 [Solirubrobacteraceae bacterium]